MAAAAGTCRLDRSPVHVLFLDGNEASRAEVAAVLQRNGQLYRVTPAGHSKQALAVLQSSWASGKGVDVVLADVNTSEDVLGVLTMINETRWLKGTPVVVMSEPGRVFDKNVLDCLEAGACDCLLKPACPQKLGNLWQHAWRKSQPRQPWPQLQNRVLTHSSAASSATKAMGDDLAPQQAEPSGSATPSIDNRLKGGHSGDRCVSDAHSDTSQTDQFPQPSIGAREQPLQRQGELLGAEAKAEAEGSGSGEGEAEAMEEEEEEDQLPGAVRVLPRGLLELAKVGNLRAQERGQMASLPGPKPWVMQLKYSNSCSAFSLFGQPQPAEDAKKDGQKQPAQQPQQPQQPQTQQLQAGLMQMPFTLDTGLVAAMAAASQAQFASHSPFAFPPWAAMLPSGTMLPLGIPGLMPQPQQLLGGFFGQALQEAMAQAASNQQQAENGSLSTPAAAVTDANVGVSHARRAAAIAKFREKRKSRNFVKKVRYQSRKRLAEERPRIRGQFVKREGPGGIVTEDQQEE